MHEAPDSVLENVGVEVQQQPNTHTSETQVSDELRHMDRHQALDTLHLDDNVALHYEIEPIGAVQANGLVDHRNLRLARERDSGLLELIAKAFLIRRLEQAGAELTMYFNGEPYDPFSHRVILERNHHV